MNPGLVQTINIAMGAEPAPWWLVVAVSGPFVLIVLVEVVVTVFLVRGRHQAKIRGGVDWDQMRWALDASVSEDPRRARMGRRALAALSQLPLSKDDRAILSAASLLPPSVAKGSAALEKPDQ